MDIDVDIRVNKLANVVDELETRIEELEALNKPKDDLKEAHKVLLECFEIDDGVSSAYPYLIKYFGSIEKAREVLK